MHINVMTSKVPMEKVPTHAVSAVAHLHDKLNCWGDPPAHGQMNLATDLLLGAAPTKGELPWVSPVSMQLGHISEWHHHLTQEDIVAQLLAPINSHLEHNKATVSLRPLDRDD